MKNILLILLLPTLAYSQFNVDTLNKKVSFVKVYEIDTVQKVLHDKVNEWFAINFKDANSVIKLNTDDKIIAKGTFLIKYERGTKSKANVFHFTSNISFKDNKYRHLVEDIYVENSNMEIPMSKYIISSIEDYKELFKFKMNGIESDAWKKMLIENELNPDNIEKNYLKGKEQSIDLFQKLEHKILMYSTRVNEYILKEIKKDGW